MNRQSIHEQVEQQAIRQVFNQTPTIWLGGLLVAALYVLGLWQTVDALSLLLWYAGIFLSLAYRYYLTVIYYHSGYAPKPSRYWVRLLERSALYQGFLWGVGGVVFFDETSLSNQVLVCVLIIGYSITAIPVNSYWLRAFFAFTLPATGFLAARLLLCMDIEHVVLGGTVVLYNLVVTSFVMSSNRIMREGLRLRFENFELVDDLQQANQAKTRFLAAASHDLRQPIHSLLLFIESLRGEVRTSKGKELLQHIDHTINSHNSLLNSLLDVSKLDAGVIEPKINAVSLRPLVEGLYHEFETSADDKGLLLYIRGCHECVQTDAGLLENILRNLLGNAISYSEQGWVMICTRARKDHVLLQIWDTGCGIAEEEQEKVFEEFLQLDNPMRDRSMGLGLGLSICKRIAELLRHPLDVKSSLGRGLGQVELAFQNRADGVQQFTGLAGLGDKSSGTLFQGGCYVMQGLRGRDHQGRKGIIKLLELLQKCNPGQPWQVQIKQY